MVKKGDKLILNINPPNLLYLKCFEALGEALPQLILNIVFMLNNHEFLINNQTFVGINELTISLTSMIFSLGSVTYGLYGTLPAQYDFMMTSSRRHKAHKAVWMRQKDKD